MARPAHLLALVFAALVLFASTDAAARKVTWTEVKVRDGGQDARRLEANLRTVLKKETRRAKWGEGDKLELAAQVTEVAWEKSDDVLRIRVTVVARIAGGKSARSHIRLGGHPRERRKLEKQALGIVASGLVTRLAAIARAGSE